MRSLSRLPRVAWTLQTCSSSSQAGFATGPVTGTGPSWANTQDGAASTSAPSASVLGTLAKAKSLLHTAVLPQERQAWDSSSSSSSAASGSSSAGAAAARRVDPFAIVHGEVCCISERLRHSVSSSIPALKQAAEYFFRPGVEGKRLRPTLVMLMGSALSAELPPADAATVDLRPANEHAPEPRRQQQRVAEIAELIHVASLLHDDVIDDAVTRRGVSSLNAAVGNKIAILAGDFLLARASVSLAALHNTTTVELMSQVLEALVSGEIMQMTATQEQVLDLEHYLQKTYCKTASLMANSLRSVAVLGAHPEPVCDMAWNYGRHLGLAFQIVDDVLDLTASSTILGKPALNDLRSGLATAPVLFAAEEVPELRPLITRKFKGDGDVAAVGDGYKMAVKYIERSNGIQRAKELAQHHCRMAAEMIESLPPAQNEHATLSRLGLLAITEKVLSRKK